MHWAPPSGSNVSLGLFLGRPLNAAKAADDMATNDPLWRAMANGSTALQRGEGGSEPTGPTVGDAGCGSLAAAVWYHRERPPLQGTVQSSLESSLLVHRPDRQQWNHRCNGERRRKSG
ncbi:hypothetical protein TARUN_10157 [Trichoderma arundinaceum]|uniref:Uncharacterized protein n=1 Tax=Trichoderma arundinaceum TaxID=490622 RepID=A0A395N895_TRIAR|nr:hypothetical protein TARUN_10157 [Trichoderma arundinaceum]